jgi:hypothetical protein
MDMEIIKQPIGEAAPIDADCIRVQELEGGRFLLNGSVLLNCGDVEPADSVSLVGGELYASYDEAEAAGLAWASDHCTNLLYVCRSDGTTPLPDMV